MANENADTMAEQGQPRGVHLLGSVPLENAEEVFRTVSSILGGRLRRIPDGRPASVPTGSAGKSSLWQAIPASR